MAALLSRRAFVQSLGALPLASAQVAAQPEKPLAGVFIILATPYHEDKSIDYGSLARQVEFLSERGVQGLVWPQMVSEFDRLSRPERLEGMRVLAQANRGGRAALILGIQGQDLQEARGYAEAASRTDADGVIAMPPGRASSLQDFGDYFKALAATTDRPFFIQTTGGAEGIEPTVEFLIDLAQEFSHFGYIKEEFSPAFQRMKALSEHRPPIRGVFSGAGGKGWLYEMRAGVVDGTMPGPMFPELYVQIWDAYRSGRREQARDVYSRLLLMLNCLEQIPAARFYVMQKRGICKNLVSRRRDVELTSLERQEIDFRLEALGPHLR